MCLSICKITSSMIHVALFSSLKARESNIMSETCQSNEQLSIKTDSHVYMLHLYVIVLNMLLCSYLKK
jgi:hypothetical protein